MEGWGSAISNKGSGSNNPEEGPAILEIGVEGRRKILVRSAIYARL